MASAVSSAGAGKSELIWPSFKPKKMDPFPGQKEMTPEQTLIEFISTSAALHGVQKESLRSLEWDILKVFPYNIMPANAAAWYMAKRKFYADQPPDQQLLPLILKKYPAKFVVSKFQVDFLETFSKETAKRKLTYLVQYGIYAYFSHKVDEYGVYFFDPNYYERTEPFLESLRICTRTARTKNRWVSSYFNQLQTSCDKRSPPLKNKLNFKMHSTQLATLTENSKVKIITNTTCVIVSMVNNQYGFIKFGSGEKALFCAKALFRDGWQYTGDPLRLPAMHFDGYQVPEGTKSGGESCKWLAVLVWCGRKPAPKYYSTLADFNLTPAGFSSMNQTSEGRRLRQPSSSMLIGQVTSIRKNGAVLCLRDGRPEKTFVPGWCKENKARPGIWLTTLSGETIGMHDLVAYYIDAEETMPPFHAVGKNVIVLKEHEEVETSKKKRRNRASVSMSEGAIYDPMNLPRGSVSSEITSESSEGEEVSDGELEWLEKDLESVIEKDAPEALTRGLLLKLKNEIAEVRASAKKDHNPRERRDSGLGSNPTTPRDNNGPLKVGKRTPDAKNFWRTKAALASIDEDYRSSDDEDYQSGDEVASLENRVSRSRRQSTNSSATSTNSSKRGKRGEGDTDNGPKKMLPYWVRALSLPEEYEETTGKFLPVDKWYNEAKDPDYYLPETDDDYDEEDEDIITEDQDAEKTEDKQEAMELAKKKELEEELKLLIEESGKDLPEDLLEGKHHPISEKVPSPEKIVVTKPDGEEEVTDIVPVEETPKPKRSIWYPPTYLKFVNAIKNTELESDVESNADPEYVPPAIILDSEMDYDEYDPEEIVPSEELVALEEEVNMDLHKAGNYIPIWVHVDSVKERVERAKEDVKRREEERAEKEAALKAAQEKEAAKEKANKEAAEKIEKEETAANEVKEVKEQDADPKPQRKQSTRSAKSEDGTTTPPNKGSPKKKSPKKKEAGADSDPSA